MKTFNRENIIELAPEIFGASEKKTIHWYNIDGKKYGVIDSTESCGLQVIDSGYNSTDLSDEIKCILAVKIRKQI
ncbi:hypothetical protein [Photobacterium kishitanii]|uniref:Uncharacterized protein n=1 Tax=Photobacterium kishitanii TaxID=318456 RepID=A0A2T3KLS9_9GAMM|nr:hypothetical protein [Photobacterium kishitanii]PSV00623.1 hypothetical protein C9J27_05660 [Photobacterium kishitanii]